MTAAFDEFMRQHKMTGSEKADGYSRDAFVGLDEHEKEKVFKLLTQELPFSVSWLFFLDPKRASEVVKEAEEKHRGDGYAHVYLLQEALVKHTGDMSYQSHMISDYHSYLERLKPRVVEAISKTPANEDALNFFKQVILTETNASAVARAALALLNALKVPRNTDREQMKYQQLKEELRLDNVQAKLKALTYLTRYEKAVL